MIQIIREKEREKEKLTERDMETRMMAIEFRLDQVEHQGEIQADQINGLDSKLIDYASRVERIDNEQRENSVKSIIFMVGLMFILYLVINLSYNFMIYKYSK